MGKLTVILLFITNRFSRCLWSTIMCAPFGAVPPTTLGPTYLLRILAQLTFVIIISVRGLQEATGMAVGMARGITCKPLLRGLE